MLLICNYTGTDKLRENNISGIIGQFALMPFSKETAKTWHSSATPGIFHASQLKKYFYTFLCRTGRIMCACSVKFSKIVCHSELKLFRVQKSMRSLRSWSATSTQLCRLWLKRCCHTQSKSRVIMIYYLFTYAAYNMVLRGAILYSPPKSPNRYWWSLHVTISYTQYIL